MTEPKGGFHPLAAPILLMLSGRNDEFEKQLAQLASFINAAQNALQSLRTGMEGFHVELAKMTPPPPHGHIQPIPRPGFWGPGPMKPNVSFKPVKDQFQETTTDEEAPTEINTEQKDL